jgi:hypothetical protein
MPLIISRSNSTGTPGSTTTATGSGVGGTSSRSASPSPSGSSASDNAGGTDGVLGMGASNVFVGLSVGAVAVFMI